MPVDNTALHNDALKEIDASIPVNDREYIEDLILQNKTLDALLKGLSEDIETFKRENSEHSTKADIVRFTMQLNIMRDKKARNLVAINKIIEEHKHTHHG